MRYPLVVALGIGAAACGLLGGAVPFTAPQGDLDLDGEPDAFTTYVHDLDGRTVRMTADWDDDGTIDNHFHYTYDAQGRRITEEWDTRLDGSRDEVLKVLMTIGGQVHVSDVLCPLRSTAQANRIGLSALLGYGPEVRLGLG